MSVLLFAYQVLLLLPSKNHTTQLVSSLSGMQLIGILAGLTFSGLVHTFKNKLITFAGIAFGLSLIAIALSPSIPLLGISALFSGYTYSTSPHNGLSDYFREDPC